ncbi:MAG: gas vesicle protein [Polyangiaceae bacterium]|nr:gas vesicle protein [Polyangiaceae bacterium]
MRKLQVRTPNTHANGSLVDLLDRLVDRGVVLTGDLMISVADVELISLQLNVLLASVERLHVEPRPILAGSSKRRSR